MAAIKRYINYVATGVTTAASITLTGARIGDRVCSATNITAPADVTAQFEGTISTVDKINQTGVTGINASDKIQVLLRRRCTP